MPTSLKSSLDGMKSDLLIFTSFTWSLIFLYSLLSILLWLITSLMANAPMMIAVNSIPSIITAVLKVKRDVGFSIPIPTVASIAPKTVINTAFFQPLPCIVQITIQAKSTRDAFPGVFTRSAALTAIGETRINNKHPIVPPIDDENVAIPIALAPSPLFIIG